MRLFLEWLSLNPDCKRMFEHHIKLLAHHKWKIGNKALPIFPQAVYEDTKLLTEAQAQIPAAVYMMLETIVPFDIWRGNISYFTSSQGTRKADTEGGRSKQVCNEWESLCFSVRLMGFFGVYSFLLCSSFFFGSIFVSFLSVSVILMFCQIEV